MAAHRQSNVIDLTPHLAARCRALGNLIELRRPEVSAVIPLPLGRSAIRPLPPLPPAA
jgi:hypothetical protein